MQRESQNTHVHPGGRDGGAGGLGAWRRGFDRHDAPEEVGTEAVPRFQGPAGRQEPGSRDVRRGRRDDRAISKWRKSTACGRFPRTATTRPTPPSTWPRPPRRCWIWRSWAWPAPTPATRSCTASITPDPAKLRPGMMGVGTRVTLKGDKDKAWPIWSSARKSRTGPARRYVRPRRTRPDLHGQSQDRQVLDQVRGLDRKRPAQAQRLRHSPGRAQRLLDRRQSDRRRGCR